MGYLNISSVLAGGTRFARRNSKRSFDVVVQDGAIAEALDDIIMLSAA